MKKNILPLLLFLNTLFLIPTKGYSQKKLSFGFRISTSLGFHTTQSMLSSSSFTPKSGYSFGALAEYKIIGPLSVRAEILYSNRGFKDKVNFTDASGNAYYEGYIKTNMNYIDLPIMAKISFGNTVKPYFLIGGFGSIFLNGKQKNNFTIPGSTADISSSPYKAPSYDFGALGGFGLDFKISSLILFTELRYNHGLVNLDLYNTKIRSLDIAAGLRF
jgi:hypothetical protein